MDVVPEDLTESVKISSVFLFGHKGLAVISQDFWVTFAFDSSLGILLQSNQVLSHIWQIPLKIFIKNILMEEKLKTYNNKHF